VLLVVVVDWRLFVRMEIEEERDGGIYRNFGNSLRRLWMRRTRWGLCFTAEETNVSEGWCLLFPRLTTDLDTSSYYGQYVQYSVLQKVCLDALSSRLLGTTYHA
jgi:hypothetical protein